MKITQPLPFAPAQLDQIPDFLGQVISDLILLIPAMTNLHQEDLVRAFEAGYFKVPKDTQLTELADAQGVSHQAMSERIRRGVHRLIEQTLIIGDSPGQDEE